MHSLRPEATRLAAAFLAGAWDEACLIERALHLVPPKSKWLPSMAKRVIRQFPGIRPLRRLLIDFICHDRRFQLASESESFQVSAFLQSPVFDCQHTAFRNAPLPHWHTVTDLACWLDLPDAQLLWFADQESLERTARSEKLRHYHYRWIRKRWGGLRLIESPKTRLKQIQRRLLNTCLQHLPVHHAAHGFCKGRSVSSFASGHTGCEVVLRMDLQDFFPSLQPHRLIHLLMLAGYPEQVARTITGLCTNSVPADALRSHADAHSGSEARARSRLLQQPHFPQGAPTSPVIANLISFRFDKRVTGLARCLGANYSRYADDLLFSGDHRFRRQISRFVIQVAAIALEEGFAVNHHKTRVMEQSVRQHATGLVLNQHANVDRREYDQLKAILHNSARHGPDSQNRREHPDFRNHLLGRINYIGQFSAHRGAKLHRLFDAIQWQAADE